MGLSASFMILSHTRLSRFEQRASSPSSRVCSSRLPPPFQQRVLSSLYHNEQGVARLRSLCSKYLYCRCREERLYSTHETMAFIINTLVTITEQPGSM